jgi:hypothetical protein
MPQIAINSFSISNNFVSLNLASSHSLSPGDQILIKNIGPNLNGYYFVFDTPSSTQIRFQKTLANTSTTFVSGLLIFPQKDTTGKAAYIYNSENDTWYLLKSKVDTNGNYQWTGAHSFQGPVSFQDAVYEVTDVITSASTVNVSGSAQISGDTVIDGQLSVNNNVVVGGSFDLTGDLFLAGNVLADGVKIYMGNTSSPAFVSEDGGILYVEEGALKYVGASGTITTIAPA